MTEALEIIEALREDLDIWKRIAIEYVRAFMLVEDGVFPTSADIERELDFAWQDAIKFSDYGRMEIP